MTNNLKDNKPAGPKQMNPNTLTKINRMSVKEFREKGYLQELNRLFLHPLGLALEIIIDQSNGHEKFGQIWDYQNDPEGLTYGAGFVSDRAAHKKAMYVSAQRKARAKSREKALGFVIQQFDLK